MLNKHHSIQNKSINTTYFMKQKNLSTLYIFKNYIVKLNNKIKNVSID